MLYWIAPIILILVLLGVSSLIRLKIPRDTSKEGENDHSSAQAYDSVSRSPLFGIIRYAVLRQLKKYRPEGILLDAGCGPGYLDMAIAARYPHIEVIGIDISREMIDLAVRNQSLSMIGRRIDYREADIEHLPFENNCADFVVSTLSIHHLAHPDQALREIARVLRPGGQLFIFDLRRDSPEALFKIINFGQRFWAPRPIRRTNGGTGSVWSSFTPQEVEMLLSESSFSTWKIQRSWGWYYVWGRK